jgi:glycosyltransferase involved in cell wall biosynthesis
VQKTVFKKYMQVLASYKKARAIAAISEASRQDYIKYLDAKAGNKVINIESAQAITNNLITTQDKRIIKKLKLQNVPYLFYIGGIDQRKNILQLLKDLKTLLPRNPNLKLVVAGKEFELIKVLDGLGWNSFLQENPNVKKSVVYAGFVTYGEATVLLKNACVFPFPSLYEGFGLPPLEAMHVGCPVVCYSNSSLPEVVGKAALIVKDGEPLAPAIQKILSSKKLGLELRQQGQEQAAKFTWKPVAEKVYNKLREIK